MIARADNGTSVIKRVDINGGNERELYKTPAGYAGISLSPDGETLSIIQSNDRNHRSLLLLPAKGGTARLIHEFVQASGGIVNHTWFPDGKSIFYIVKGQLPKDSEGSNWTVVRVPVDGGQVSEQTIKFGGPIYGLEFSPNGRLVAFTGRNGASTESEVWVIENLKNELKSLMPAAGKKR